MMTIAAKMNFIYSDFLGVHMRKNIGTSGRVIRFGIAIALAIYALWMDSWIALILSAFTFYEAFFSWCIVKAIWKRFNFMD